MTLSRESERPTMGLLEWFHLNDRDHVKRAVRQIQEIGISHLRTGISWADYHSDEGRKWMAWLIPYLAQHVQILPCLLYTPPSIGLSPKTSAPPRYRDYFADFTKEILDLYGDHFDWVELWNEPNNTSEYDFRLDPGWEIFADFIGQAADVVHNRQKRVLLGGMSPVDPGWLNHMFQSGLMEKVDAVGIHGFPGTFDSDWPGWEEAVQQTQAVIDRHNGLQKIWITEAGFSTWLQDERQQVREFIKVSKAPVERVYWYSLNDLPSERPTVDGFHLDDRSYHFGMHTEEGHPKLLYRLIQEHGVNGLDRYPWITRPHITIPKQKRGALITGGGGFIGTNLAHRLLEEGKPVTILDNLGRPGVERNIDWLRRTHKQNLNITIADIRNPYKVQKTVGRADFVYHLAAQVAVTTSQEDPRHDFHVNLNGTMNLLEAIRKSDHRPPLIFTSTNKVYGKIKGLKLYSDEVRYHMQPKQINEETHLDFQSPYGCSKGAADAYVLDYARTYGLKAAVFRMSCIYGPHQLGTEDQGWVAHFLIQALNGNPLTIFGDGKQVRDILYVDDLVNAFQIASEKIDTLTGNAFNIGGGFENSVSLRELISYLEELTGEKIPCSYAEWRTGDQRYYISDTGKFHTLTGWQPKVSVTDGIDRLHNWLCESEPVALKSAIA